jgi:hypothetical protein
MKKRLPPLKIHDKRNKNRKLIKNKKGDGKMKKIICLILVLVTMVGVTACNSNKENENTKNPTETTPTIENQPIYANGWEMHEGIAVPSINETKWENKKYGNDTMKVGTTPLSFDGEEILTACKKDEAIRAMFDDLFYYQYDYHLADTNPDGGNEIYFTINQHGKVEGRNTQNDAKMLIDASRYVHQFTTPNSLTLSFENVEKTATLQEEIYEVAKMVFGSSAEYLVYAKDSDGKTLYDTEIGNNAHLEDIIKVGNSEYFLTRTIYLNENKVTAQFSLYLKLDEKFEVFTHRFDDEETDYNENPYTMNSVLSNKFTPVTPLNYETFTEKIMNTLSPSYNRVQIADWRVSERKHEQDIWEYEYNMWLFAKNSQNEVTGSYSYDINVKEENSQITEIGLSITAKTYDNYEAGQTYVDVCTKFMQDTVKGLKITTPKYDDAAGKWTGDVTCTINGQKCTGVLEISPENGEASLRITL